MRVYRALLLLTAAALTSTCASSRPFDSFPKPGEVVLEINTNAGGVVYPQGDILDFRLYENGRVEYDDYPPPVPGTPQDEISITRKDFQLTAADMNELKDLAAQPDFLNAQPEYPAARPVVDSRFVKTIVYKHQGSVKKIVITDYEDDVSGGTMSRYPKSLISLLERVRELKAKATNKS